jgi:predicted RNase H-like HicB family nuclease
MVKLTIELDREDDGRWIAEVLELPGVMCYGQTRDQAIGNAERLAIEVIADRIAGFGLDREEKASFLDRKLRGSRQRPILQTRPTLEPCSNHDMTVVDQKAQFLRRALIRIIFMRRAMALRAAPRSWPQNPGRTAPALW